MKCLQDHAVALGHLRSRFFELLIARRRVELKAECGDVRETHRRRLVDSEGATCIPGAFSYDLTPAHGDAQRRGHGGQRHAGTCDERFEEEVGRAC